MYVYLSLFRFRCLNVDHTLDFWMGCLHAEVTSRLNSGTKTRVIIKFHKADVGLRFDYDRLGYRTRTYPTVRTTMGKLPAIALTPVQLNLYVYDVARVVTRCRNKGFVIVHDAFSPNPLVRAASVLDPNGIRVNFFESNTFTDQVSPSHSRLAYLERHLDDVSVIQEVTAFYEKISATSASSLIGVESKSQTTRTLRKSSAIQPTGASIKDWGLNRKQKDKLFRLVDSEQFLEDLASYAWYGNGSRAQMCTLCLSHRIRVSTELPRTFDGKASVAFSVLEKQAQSSTREDYAFLGMVFRVFDLADAIMHLVACGVLPEDTVPNRIPDFPQFVEFIDPAHNPIEITDDVVIDRGKKTMYKSTDLAKRINTLHSVIKKKKKKTM